MRKKKKSKEKSSSSQNVTIIVVCIGILVAILGLIPFTTESTECREREHRYTSSDSGITKRLEGFDYQCYDTVIVQNQESKGASFSVYYTFYCTNGASERQDTIYAGANGAGSTTFRYDCTSNERMSGTYRVNPPEKITECQKVSITKNFFER